MPLSKIACWKSHHFMDVSPSCRTSICWNFQQLRDFPLQAVAGYSPAGSACTFASASCASWITVWDVTRRAERAERAWARESWRLLLAALMMGQRWKQIPSTWENALKNLWKMGTWRAICRTNHETNPKRTDFWWIFGAKNLGKSWKIHSWHRKIPTGEAAPLDTTLLSSNLINECLGDPWDPTGSHGIPGMFRKANPQRARCFNRFFFKK